MLERDQDKITSSEHRDPLIGIVHSIIDINR